MTPEREKALEKVAQAAKAWAAEMPDGEASTTEALLSALAALTTLEQQKEEA